MSNITDQELMNEYVLLSKHEYMGSIKALQAIDIIDGILNTKMYAGDSVKKIKLVLGKSIEEDEDD